MQGELGESLEWVRQVRGQGKVVVQVEAKREQLALQGHVLGEYLLNNYLRADIDNPVLLEGYKYIRKYLDTHSDLHLFWLFSSSLKDSYLVETPFRARAGTLQENGFYRLEGKEWEGALQEMGLEQLSLLEGRLERVLANWLLNYQIALNRVGAAWMSVFCKQQDKWLLGIAQKERVSLQVVRQMAQLKGHHLPTLLDNMHNHLAHPDLFLLTRPFPFYWAQFPRLEHNFGRLLEFQRHPHLLKYTDMLFLLCLEHPALEEDSVKTLRQTELLQHLEGQCKELQKHLLQAEHLLLLDHFTCYLHALHRAHPHSPLLSQLLDSLWTNLCRLLHRHKHRLLTTYPSGPPPSALQPIANLLRRQLSESQGKQLGQLGVEIEQILDILSKRR